MAVQVRHVDRWVSEGIISPDQAESICEYERRVTPSRGSVPEIVGYIGAANAVGAVMILVSDIWGEQTRGSRFAVLAVTSVSMVIIGAIAAHEAKAWVERFGRVLMMLAVPMAAYAGNVATGRWLDTEESILVGFGVAWLLAAPLYLRWKSATQHAALFFATVGVTMSLAGVLSGPSADIALAGAAFVVAVVWMGLSTAGRISPRLIGEILGGVVALVGSALLAFTLDSGTTYALALFALVSGIGVSLGVRYTRTPLIVTGMIGLVTYLPMLSIELSDTSFTAPLIMLAVGILLTVFALAGAKRN